MNKYLSMVSQHFEKTSLSLKLLGNPWYQSLHNCWTLSYLNLIYKQKKWIPHNPGQNSLTLNFKVATCYRFWKSQYTMISGQYLNLSSTTPNLNSSHLSTGGSFLLQKSIHYLFWMDPVTKKKPNFCGSNPSIRRCLDLFFQLKTSVRWKSRGILPSSLGDQFWGGAVLAIGSVSFLGRTCPLERFWWAWKMMNFYFWKWSLFRFQATC